MMKLKKINLKNFQSKKNQNQKNGSNIIRKKFENEIIKQIIF